MNFAAYVKEGFRMLLFSKAAVRAVLADNNGRRNGFMMLFAVSAVLGLLTGMAFYGALFLVSRLDGIVPLAPSPALLVTVTILAFLLAVISNLLPIGITHAVAKTFGGRQYLGPYFAVGQSVEFAVLVVSLPFMLLAAVPVLGIIAQIAFFCYTLAVAVFVVRESYRITLSRAIGVVFIPLIILGALLALYLVLTEGLVL